MYILQAVNYSTYITNMYILHPHTTYINTMHTDYLLYTHSKHTNLELDIGV